MKILSVRQGFASDHSSTSYEFLAVDRPLTHEQRAAVSSLSSRANPTGRRVSFIYHAEGYDIPGGWEPLLAQYYDVMWSESYDVWTLAMAFPASKELQEELARYEFDNGEGLGVFTQFHDERAIVSVGCRLDGGAMYDLRGGDGYEEDEDEEEEDGASGESEDAMLDLLIRVRQQLMERDYRCLYAVWETYGWEVDGDEEDEDEEFVAPPQPPSRRAGTKVVQEFAGLLAEE